jgi:hypothetical protein
MHTTPNVKFAKILLFFELTKKMDKKAGGITYCSKGSASGSCTVVSQMKSHMGSGSLL